jgi:Tfp pilus assembly protein PilX
LIRILAKSLKKEPKDRYTSCKLLQADLDSAVLTLKRRKDGWSRQTWGIILAGCIPIFLFGGFMAVRYSSANTNKVSVAGDELKAYNHLLKLAVADLQKGNVDAAREKLLKCIKMELPESQRYMRWRAYEYLHLVSRDKDSFKKCSEGMLSIVESKDFSHASISSDEKLQWRLRSYLCGAETGDDDAHVANFLEKAEVLLQSKTGRKLAFVEKEWLRFFSAKAGLLRSQGKFLQAAETDRKAYAFAERNLRDPVKIAEYCGKGLSNCIETKTPSNCAEPHRSMLLKLLAASRGGSAETLDLAMRTTGNDPKSLINFARQVRATAFYLSKKNNAAVEWVVLNMYRSAADLNDGSLLGLIVPSELVYLENATKMTLLETKDPTFAQYDASINLIGAIVRYKILTAGESDAIATGNSLISSFQNPAWRLKALANVDFNLAKERKLKLSLNAREAFNTRFSELLLAAATDPKTQAGFQNDDLVIEATGRMYNAMVYQGLTSQQRTEVYGRWYKVLKESPLASPVLKVRLLSLMAVGLTQSQKQEKNARTFAERCACDLLELLPLCKLYNRASVDVYANALDYISYGLNVQVSPRRLELETKIFDSFQSHDFFKSSDLKGKCLVQWLMIALYCESSSTCAIPLPEGQLDSVASMVTEHAPTVKGNDAEWALSESVRAVVGLYKGKGNTAKAVAYASKIMDIAAKNGCSKSTIENLKKQLEIAKS